MLGSPVLPSDALAELLVQSVWRERPAGTLLISRRDPAHDLWLVASGDAVLGAAVPDGVAGVRTDSGAFRRERSVHGPDWLDASSAWLGGDYGQDALAVSEVALVAIRRQALQQVLQHHPVLGCRLVQVLAQQVRLLTAATHDLMHKDAETRFATWLLQHAVADEAEPGTAVVALHERKRDIAAQLAITPETFSRLLRALGRKGLIDAAGYTVKVLDLRELERLAAA